MARRPSKLDRGLRLVELAAAAMTVLAGCARATSPQSVASFTVTSTDVHDGQAVPVQQLSGLLGAGGGDVSPQLSWSGFPGGTQSFAVTMVDRDVGAGRGFWHWAVVDIPATVTALPSGAGAEAGALPPPAFQLTNDAHVARYVGPAPPAGSGTHHYVITVDALDVPAVAIARSAPAASLHASLSGHVLARATLTPIAEARAGP